MAVQQLKNVWVLETRTTGYALGLHSTGHLIHLYWGKRLPQVGDYLATTALLSIIPAGMETRFVPEEYPAHGGLKFVDPCLKVTLIDGVRELVLGFESAEVSQGQDSELTISLKDADFPLRVLLHYRVHEAHDLIERWVTVENEGEQPVILERIFSAEWHLPYGGTYRLTHAGGRFAHEMQLRQDFLTAGLKVLESRRGITSYHHNPWFAVDRGETNENQGEVWFGVLAWSGNWKLAAEVTDYAMARINIGVNDWDFAWRLASGESFTTPSSFGGYTTEGFGASSRMLHDFIRDKVLPHGRTPHQVLFNSWEATLFDVDEPSQIRLAELAAQLGVELFVMDDGWFHGRNNDRAGLGDWWPDEQKFPNGLKPLIEKVNALGMEFGLWIEPEAINPDSELYRLRPEWALHFPNRPRSEWRNQLTLNLARNDVQEFLIDTFDSLLREHNIRFIKWDMNRDLSEPGWPSTKTEPREIWVRYVHGLYRVWGTLRARHPQVIWQSCAGGGARADTGILHLADQIWVSDNTEAASRLGIQEGFSYIYPANTMEAWVTDVARERNSLEFRFHVSMCGSLGIGGDLGKWSQAELDEAARLIAQYKAIRPIVQFGDLYRLRSPQRNGFSAVQYVSKDRAESVLFAFRTYIQQPVNHPAVPLPPILLRGLDPDAGYAVEGYPAPLSGRAWMETGLRVDLQDFQSTLRRIHKVG